MAGCDLERGRRESATVAPPPPRTDDWCPSPSRAKGELNTKSTSCRTETVPLPIHGHRGNHRQQSRYPLSAGGKTAPCTDAGSVTDHRPFAGTGVSETAAQRAIVLSTSTCSTDATLGVTGRESVTRPSANGFTDTDGDAARRPAQSPISAIPDRSTRPSPTGKLRPSSGDKTLHGIFMSHTPPTTAVMLLGRGSLSILGRRPIHTSRTQNSILNFHIGEKY